MERFTSAVKHPRRYFKTKRSAKQEEEETEKARDEERTLRHSASSTDARTLVYKASYPSTATTADGGSDYHEPSKPGEDLAIEIKHGVVLGSPLDQVEVAQIVLPSQREDAGSGKSFESVSREQGAVDEVDAVGAAGVIGTITEETEAEAEPDLVDRETGHGESQKNGHNRTNSGEGSAATEFGVMIRYETWEMRRYRMHHEDPSSTLPGSWPGWFE